MLPKVADRRAEMWLNTSSRHLERNEAAARSQCLAGIQMENSLALKQGAYVCGGDVPPAT